MALWNHSAQELTSVDLTVIKRRAIRSFNGNYLPVSNQCRQSGVHVSYTVSGCLSATVTHVHQGTYQQQPGTVSSYIIKYQFSSRISVRIFIACMVFILKNIRTNVFYILFFFFKNCDVNGC